MAQLIDRDLLPKIDDTDPDATIAFLELVGLKEVRRMESEKGRRKVRRGYHVERGGSNEGSAAGANALGDDANDLFVEKQRVVSATLEDDGVAAREDGVADADDEPVIACDDRRVRHGADMRARPQAREQMATFVEIGSDEDR